MQQQLEMYNPSCQGSFIRPRNNLKGTLGDKINTLLADAAYNMKKWMAWQKDLIFVLLRFLFSASCSGSGVR